MAVNRSELRIGNHIQHGTILELHEQFALIRLFNGSQPQMNYNDINPLPVTTGYLTIVGFAPHGAGWHRTGIILLQENRGYFIRRNNEYVNGRPILYVHHLENLYYDLTGIVLPDNTDERDAIIDSN